MSTIHSGPAPRFQGRKEAAPKQSVNPLKTAFMGFLALNPFAAAAASSSANDKFSRSQLATQVQHPSLPTVHADLFHKRNTPKQQAKMDALIDLIHQEDADHPFTRSLKQDADVEAASAAEVEAAIASLTDPEAQQILKNPPFAPKNINLLGDQSYPGSKPYFYPPATPGNENAIRLQLKNNFLKRYNGNEQIAEQTVALLDDPQLIKLAPDLKIRAALVNLNGTFGEPALATYRKGLFNRVNYDSSVPTELNARSITLWGNSKPQIQINPLLKGEDFQQLTNTVFHENLHQDSSDSSPEELINNSLDSLLHASLVLENPSIIKQGTAVTRTNNMKLLGRLNSRDRQGNMRITQTQGLPILANSIRNYKSFDEYYREEDPSYSSTSDGNPTLDAVLSKVLGRPIQGARFDEDTLALLDQQIILSHQKILQLLGPQALDTNIPLDEIEKKNIPPTAAPSPQENTAPPPNPQEEPPTQIPLQTYTTPTLEALAPQSGPSTSPEAVEPAPAPAPTYATAALAPQVEPVAPFTAT